MNDCVLCFRDSDLCKLGQDDSDSSDTGTSCEDDLDTSHEINEVSTESTEQHVSEEEDEDLKLMRQMGLPVQFGEQRTVVS